MAKLRTFLSFLCGDNIDYETLEDENRATCLGLDWLYGRSGVVSCCGARPPSDCSRLAAGAAA